MEDSLREMIELARIEAEYALLETRTFGLAHVNQLQRHIEALIVHLDTFLEKARPIEDSPPPETLN